MSADVLTLALWAVCVLALLGVGLLIERHAPRAGSRLLPEPPVDVQVWRERHQGARDE